MRALAIVHQRDAGPGVFGDALRARSAEVECWMPPEEPSPPDRLERYDAVLAFGGAMHADQEDRHPWLRDEKELLAVLLEKRVPILAVCLGAQLLAEAAGASPRRARRPEIGWLDVEVSEGGRDDPLLGPLAPGFTAFQWHSYEFPLPQGATALAGSAVCLQGFRIDGRTWGIQFHAEVSRADAEAWIDDYESDEDAVRTGLDPDRLRLQTRQAIDGWNELGRQLCERFLDTATRA
jgi:GMP synthase-like glutamine amidotransferase